MTIRGYIEPAVLERLVNKKLMSFGITSSDYPINPYKLIKSENIELHEENIGNHDIKGMIVHGDNCTGILINANRSYVSKRFIAMHELSHHWFHPHDNEIICFENYAQNYEGMEWQANNAAAYALMPTELVTELFEISDGDIEYICNCLKVSPESLHYRIKELGLKVKPAKRHVFMHEADPELRILESSWLYGGF